MSDADYTPPQADEIDCRNIYERIEAARPHFKPVVRNAAAQVGARSYNYADLGVVVDAVEGALLSEGVGIYCSVLTECVVTTLRIITASATGDATSLRCAVPLPTDLTPQQTGSAITYFRRYGLVALLNLVTEADDDGASASGTGGAARTSRVTAPEDKYKAPEPALPEGWESVEQAQHAHVQLVSRIQGLHPDFKEPVSQFREEHGWPLSVTDFNELEEVVRVAEGLGA